MNANTSMSPSASMSADQLVREARKNGRDVTANLRQHPELRAGSELARLADRPAWKRLAVEVAARFPVFSELLLRTAFGLANGLGFLPFFKRLSLRLLRARIDMSFLRGALEVASWQKLQEQFGKRLPVLMYHHVATPQPDSEPTLLVSATRFEAQIRFLAKRGYVGIRTSDWMQWIRDGEPLPAKAVLITFDDAIADLHEHAFPVLERYGFSATVFVPTNCVGKGNLWNHSLGYKWRPCLSEEQIRDWSMRGIEFGAHSRNHPDLTQLGERELEDEVAGSRSDLEKIIGSPVTSFAYPYGPYNATASACVQRYFDLGFTTDEGVNTLRTERSLLRRVTVFDWDTMLEFGLMLRLGWNPIRRLRGSLRIRTRLSGILRRARTVHD